MGIGKITSMAFLAMALSGCAPNNQVVKIDLTQEDAGCSMQYNLEEDVIICGHVRYDFKTRPLKTNTDSFGPTLPDTVTTLYSTKTLDGRMLLFAQERYKGARQANTVWGVTPDGKYFQLEFDRSGKPWGERILDQKPERLNPAWYDTE